MIQAKGSGPAVCHRLTARPAKAPHDIVRVPIMAEAEPNWRPWSDSAMAAEFGPTKPCVIIKLIMQSMITGIVIQPAKVRAKALKPGTYTTYHAPTIYHPDGVRCVGSTPGWPAGRHV